VNDGRPVLTLVGSEPMNGDDVLQLEEALLALGYDSLTADGVFDADTKAAVMAWQEASGMVVDGVVGRDEIVFTPGELRITGQAASPGSTVNVGAPVLTVTSSEIAVTADLPAEDQQILAAGDEVTIELPDFTTTPATVQSVASVATRVEGGGNQATFEVIIILDDPAAAGDLDEAPVQVQIITDSADDVVAVPVTALLALREGGYAVELVLDDGTTQLVAVEPGFYADGLVEVAGLQPGDEVVVP
jgi:peptidoglycan hydrolase-like protein with peptidoglycan-binding domain